MNFKSGKLYTTTGQFFLDKNWQHTTVTPRIALALPVGSTMMFLEEKYHYKECKDLETGETRSVRYYVSYWLPLGMDKRIEIPWSAGGVGYFKNRCFTKVKDW